jgi:hypothetical protein
MIALFGTYAANLWNVKCPKGIDFILTAPPEACKAPFDEVEDS